jgi:hypothetical protein
MHLIFDQPPTLPHLSMLGVSMVGVETVASSLLAHS